ncbi:thiamine diphosphokinase [Staphylococcus muscae]|uniref:Thiamine diphosphokinase n=1 Tax=Staphylococcus muscae TaxID=1294 RepID=A0A240C107_9STAP|nr:thiamine diphosphokinase [Staphylococcus muscae]AVQ32829.1 thiamine diphosphokinase [Staphylococcus muscae]PNZ04179.1 thiamine diphosphokinase [Staphylococcus muscae]GGA80856.1 thiamine pyrophosphokinase [Staphylococcus muscae]SNW01781.1 thiamine pyrophosphokinase [Staphylococcus muscae]
MSKRIHLLCSDRYLPEGLFETLKDAEWGGVDRGTKILLEQGIQPTFTVGDFDSVTDAERAWISEHIAISPVPAEKADTDLGLAVAEAVAHGYKEIAIYGATGGRLDHFMGAMQLLKAPSYQACRIELIDIQNEITLLSKGCYDIQCKSQFPYISFVPANEQVTLSLKGFKYDLDEETLEIGTTLTISNEFHHEHAQINVHEGLVYQIRSRDMTE